MRRGSMVIQVRSVLLSQEWEVMVEPSAEASLPTRRRVEASNSAICPVSLGAGPDAAKAQTKMAARGIRKRKPLLETSGFLMTGLLPNKGRLLEPTSVGHQIITRKRSWSIN